MKFNFTTIILGVILIFVAGSCTLEKRVYSKGYHVHWKKGLNISKNQVNNKIATVNETLNSRYKSEPDYREVIPDHAILKHYKPSSISLATASIVNPSHRSFQSNHANINEVPIVQNILTASLSILSMYNNASNPIHMTQKTNHSQAEQGTKKSKRKKLRNALLIIWLGVILTVMGLGFIPFILIGVGFLIFGAFKLFKLRNTAPPSSLVTPPEQSTAENPSRESWNKFLMGLIYVLLIAGTLIATVSVIAYSNSW